MLSKTPIVNFNKNPYFFTMKFNRKFSIKEKVVDFIEKTPIQERNIKTEILNRENEKTQVKTLTQNFYTYMERGFKDPRHLDYYIEQGVDIASNNNYALTLACKEGDLEMMKRLIIYGADITSNRGFLLNTASLLGHFEIVKFLVYSYRYSGGDLAEPFTLACKNGHLDIVKFLHDHGAPLEGGGFRGEPIKFATDPKVIEYLNRFINDRKEISDKRPPPWVIFFIAGMFIMPYFIEFIRDNVKPCFHTYMKHKVFKEETSNQN